MKGVQTGPLKVLFLHGWHSVPGGVKPTYLEDAGHEVLNPTLDDDNFDAAVRTAQAEFDQHRPDVIVGSSRGGAVAMNINSGDTPLVLLCPAWKNWGTATTTKSNSAILHSRQDDLIPFADSEELVTNSGLPPETLIEVGSDHRLADEESLSVMLWACNLLASGERLPWLDDEQQSPAASSSNSKSTSQGIAKGGNRKSCYAGTFYFARGLRLMRVRACHEHREHHEVGLLTMS